MRIYIEYRLDYANVGGNLIIISKLFEVGKSNSLLVLIGFFFSSFSFFFFYEKLREIMLIVPFRAKQRGWLVQMYVTISLWFKRRDILLYAAFSNLLSVVSKDREHTSPSETLCKSSLIALF